MSLKQVINLISKKKWFVFWMTILGAVLAFNVVVSQVPQYKASSKVLVVQKQVGGQDIYSISKSAQYLCKVLEQGIHSDSFFQKVIDSSYEVELANFSSDPKERRKEWEKSIKVRMVRDLGVMEIDVFHPRKEKAEQISWAITNILEQEHPFYHGAGKNVEIKILDNSLVSAKPVDTPLYVGSILGALMGFLFGTAWVLRKREKEEATL